MTTSKFRNAPVSIRESDDGFYGSNITVSLHHIKVAFIQGAELSDVNQSAIRQWARNAFDGMSETEIEESVKYGGINRMTADDFPKRRRA